MKPALKTTLFIAFLSALFHATAFSNLLPWSVNYSDVLPFFQNTNHQIPYVDSQLEYPVLTGLFIYLSAIIGQNQIGYYLVSSIGLITCAVLITYFLAKLSTNSKTTKRLWLFTLSPSLLVFALYNWDLLALLPVIVMLYFVNKNKHLPSVIALTLGFLIKFFPIIYLPIVILKFKKPKQIFLTLSLFLGLSFLIYSPLILTNASWQFFFTFNQVRPPSPDSIWALIQLFIPTLSIATINSLSAIIFIGLSLLCLLKLHQKPLKLTLALTLSFLIANKVLSPQFILWLLPLFVLVPNVSAKIIRLLELVNLIVLFTILSVILNQAGDHVYAWTLIFSLVRHIILITTLAFLLFAKNSTRLSKKAQSLGKIRDQAPVAQGIEQLSSKQ